MIHDARHVPLVKVVNERGHLQEMQRNDEPHFPGFGQTYVTSTLPGVIKAWYRHTTQFDQLALISGHATVTLFDDRPGSPSEGQVDTWELTEESPGLIQVPRGVWHGFAARGSVPLYLLHLNTIPFDPDNVDEERIDPDSPDIPFTW